VNAASDSRRLRLLLLTLAVLTIVLLWTSVEDQSTFVRIGGLSLFVILNTVTIVRVLWRVLLAPDVTFDILCASIALYLLIGTTWTLSYIVLDILNPDAFKLISMTAEKGWTEFLYFSFATLTTLGYCDISPSAAFVRIWAVMEAVTGVLYLAILVARLVSLYRT